jgi:hypothetical protein
MWEYFVEEEWKKSNHKDSNWQIKRVQFIIENIEIDG